MTETALESTVEEETDAGPKDRAPLRRCIVTRQSRPADELLRFVRGPEGEVVFDAKRRLPGRGAWVTATAEAVATAARKNHFSRAFRSPTRVPDDLVTTVRRQLVSGFLGALGLERRAGRLGVGFAECEALLRSGRAVLLLHAREAAGDGVRKLDQAAHAGGGSPLVLRSLGTEEMSLALGRGNVIHAALQASPGSEAAVTRGRLVENYGIESDVARDVAGRNG